MYPMAHKTVFILDHGPATAVGCGHKSDVDALRGGDASEALCEKSVWTCSAEAALEYHRIVNDLFPDNRLLRFVVSDFVGRFLTTSWMSRVKSAESLLERLADLGAPDPLGDPDACCIINGISLAVEALSEATDAQKAARRLSAASPFVNRGRIVVLTQLKQDEELSMIEQHISEQITSRNKLVQNLDDNYLPLDEVEVCVLSPYVSESTLATRRLTKVADALWSELRSVSAVRLVDAVHALLVQHFNLASTTVTGIPMKEESNSGSSVHYDVELFHPLSVHADLDRVGLLTLNSDVNEATAGARASVQLLWATPTPSQRNAADHLLLCSNAERATPVNVASRPSVCLASFVLNDRTVMLEVDRRRSANVPTNFGGKLISHLLMAHGGAVYCHSLALGKGALEDAPPMTDGPGGRVSDYRMQHFNELMRECELAPADPTDGAAQSSGSARRHAARITRFWPMTLGESLLFSAAQSAATAQRFEPLLKRVKQADMSDADVEACKTCIFDLVQMEQRSEPLFTSGAHCAKLKSCKGRDEQYRQLFEELSGFLRNYAHYSERHLNVLNCLRTCTGHVAETALADDDVADSAYPELIGDSSDKAKKVEEPPSKKPKFASGKDGESTSLYQYFLDRYEKKFWSKWRDFDGRVNATTSKVELYPDLNKRIQEKRALAQPDAMDTA